MNPEQNQTGPAAHPTGSAGVSPARPQATLRPGHPYTGDGHAAAPPLLGGLSRDSLEHLAGSLKKQWKRYRKVLKRCQREFSATAIHAARVETRRLLATIDLLGGFLPAGKVKKVRRALKRHLDAFDALRDTQVQLLIVGKRRRRFAAARPFYDYLRRREERLAKQTRKAVKDIKTRRLGRLLTACQEAVEAYRKDCSPKKANALLLGTVSQAFARTSQLRAAIDPRDVRTIHCTRVAFKRFRYMVEALRHDLPAVDGHLLKVLHHYQTLMGNIQDVEVLLRALDKFLCKQALEPGPARRLRAALLQRRQRLVQVYLTAADQLFEFWPLPKSHEEVLPAARKPNSRAGVSPAARRPAARRT